MKITEFLDPVVTLFATFIGAWLAFRYETRRRNEDEKQAKIAGYNKAMYTLGNMLSIMRQFKEDVLDRAEKETGNRLCFGYSLPISAGIVNIEAKEVLFILNEDIQAFENMMLEERKFHHLLRLIEERSEFVRSMVLPALERSEIPSSNWLGDDQLKEILGKNSFDHYIRMSEAVASYTPNNIASLEVAINRAHSVMKTLYPKEKHLIY